MLIQLFGGADYFDVASEADVNPFNECQGDEGLRFDDSRVGGRGGVCANDGFRPVVKLRSDVFDHYVQISVPDGVEGESSLALLSIEPGPSADCITSGPTSSWSAFG